MLKIIIADDERAIRESISQLIDWEGLGLELVGVCKNGLEALDMILDEAPDIVLTDIKMPGLSGVELVERIALADQDTQFILLSGYSEFTYAQTAMKYGVKHYLLKPSSEEQIVDCLKKVIQDCHQLKALRQLAHQQEEDIYSFQRGILINIIAEVASELTTDFTPIYEPHRQYLDFTYTDYIMGFLYGVERESLTGLYQEILDFHQNHAPGIPLHGLFVRNCLMIFCPSYSMAEESTKRLMARLTQQYRLIDSEVRSFKNLATLLDELLLYTQHYGTIFYVGPGKLIPVSNFQNIYKKVKDCSDRLLTICEHPEDSQPERLQTELRRLSSILYHISNLDYMYLLVSSLLVELSNHELGFSSIEAIELLQKLHRYDDPNRIREELIAYLTETLQSSAATAHGRMVQQIKDYVKANLSDPNLTLKQIAETYLYMNVDYVSKRFLKETGHRFSTYLTEVRIQKAIHLLTSGEDIKIQSIAEQVGCGNNPQYFSQVFKKSTGLTPSAYLRKVRG